jgi:hypothetical protein
MNFTHPFYPRDRSFFKGGRPADPQTRADFQNRFKQLVSDANAAYNKKPVNPLAPVNSIKNEYVKNKNALGGESYTLLS